MRRLLLTVAAVVAAGALAACAEPRFRDGERSAADDPEPAQEDRAQTATADTGDADDPGRALVVTTPGAYMPAKDRARAALTAGADDGLAEADAGYYMDVQEAALRGRLAGRAVTIGREGRRIRVVLAGGTAFGTGSAHLNASAEPILAAIAGVLDEYRQTLVTIAAHTDPSGDAGLNRELSEARALAVAERLTRAGVAPARIVVVGYGESRPAPTDTSPASRSPDRRIELLLEPLVATATD